MALVMCTMVNQHKFYGDGYARILDSFDASSRVKVPSCQLSWYVASICGFREEQVYLGSRDKIIVK